MTSLPPAPTPQITADGLSPSDRATVELFLNAYRHGAFPMAEPAMTRSGRPRVQRRIDWFIPDPRAIIDIRVPINAPGGFHVPRSLHRRLRGDVFTLKSDAAFEEVIRACAKPGPGREDTWIDERLVRAYTLLHAAGHVHSIEAWCKDREGKEHLVGGIYGVALGGVFCAESMFCRPELGGTDASKVCLAHLVKHLQMRGFSLLDVQIANQHTLRFGVVEVSNTDYLARLKLGMQSPCSWGEFDAKWHAPELDASSSARGTPV